MVFKVKIKILLVLFVLSSVQAKANYCEQLEFDLHKLNVSNCLTNELATLENKLQQILLKNPSIYEIVISKTAISEIPLCICQHQNLKSLHIYSSNLTLDNNCFKNLINLGEIEIFKSPLSYLQNGVFDGLKSLQYLSIRYTSLQNIGDFVFNDPSKHPKLTAIDLSYNNLTTVDVWPWKYAVFQDNMNINLKSNSITKATNNLKWFLNIDSITHRHIFEYDVRSNPIDYIENFVMNFFPGKYDFLIFYSKISVRINLDMVKIICDCLQYKTMKLIKSVLRTQAYNFLICRIPLKLKNMPIVQISDEEFQCRLPAESCPHDCVCTQVPGNYSFIIECKNSEFFSFPKFLPSVDTPTKFSVLTAYELRFHFLSLKKIENYDYLNVTKIFDVQNNNISKISSTNWEYLENIENVYLDFNNLNHVPLFTLTKNSKLKKLSLTNNPWNCACEHKEFKEWLKNISKQLTLINPDSILCHSPTWLAGRNIFTVEDHEFCQNPFDKQKKRLLLVVLLPISCIFAFFIVSFLLLRRFKVQLNTYLAFHPFDRDECVGEHMDYDVFVSSSFCDRKLAIQLVKLLEDKGYRVCYHEKDFIGGQSITLNICHAVWCSKRVLCIVTKDFLKSHYCLYEFEQALQRNIQLGKKRLIILLDEYILNDPYEIPTDLNQYLSSHTYIALKNKIPIVDQILYAMPILKTFSNP